MANILLDNIQWKGMGKLRRKLLRKAGRLGKQFIPAPNDIVQTMLGGRGFGYGAGEGTTAGRVQEVDTGATFKIATPNVTFDPISSEKATELAQKTIGNPMSKAISEYNYSSAVSTALDTTASEEVQENSAGKGRVVAMKFAGGVTEGINSFITGGGDAVYNLPAVVSAVVSAMGNGEYWAGGDRAGTSWAAGFNFGVLTHIMDAVNGVAFITIGNSPPKGGPLRNIDKGGENIGKAWARGIHSGAERELGTGMKSLQSRMSQRGAAGGFDVQTNVQHKKSIDININVKGGAGSDTETQNAMRRGVYDALVDSEILTHMVTIS